MDNSDKKPIDLLAEKQKRYPTTYSSISNFSAPKFKSYLYTIVQERNEGNTLIQDAQYGTLKEQKVIVISKTPLSTPEQQKQFAHDLRNCQESLSISDWGLDEQQRPVIVTDAPTGEKLSQIIKPSARNPLSLRTVANYTRQIAHLVDSATSSRIRTRLRPEHIWVDADGKIRLEIQKYGLTNGEEYRDFLYHWPELCASPTSPFTPEGGQYIVGLLTYEMLAGAPPFRGTAQVVSIAHQKKSPPPLIKLPHNVSDVVMKALAKQPQDRYRDLQELATQFEKASRRNSLTLWLHSFTSFLRKVLGTRQLTALLKSQHHKPVNTHRRALVWTSFKLTGAALLLVGSGITGALIEHSLSYGHETVKDARPAQKPTSGSSLPLQITYRGHSTEVMKVAFSPDGQLVASGDRNGYIHIWDPLTGKRLFPIYDAHSAPIVSITWYKDKAGNLYLISSSSEGTLTIWTPDNYVIATCPSEKLPGKAIKAMARSISDEHLVVAADESIVAFDFPLTKQFSLPDVTFEVGNVHTVDLSPVSPNIVACGGADATLKLWNIENGTLSKSFDSEYGLREVRGIAWKPDGSLIATVGGEVLLWDVNKGTIYEQYPDIQDTVNCIAWRDDSLFAIGSDNAIVQLLDINGNLKGSYQHNKPVYDLAWSPEGRLLASASSDQTIQVRRVNF